MRARILGLAKAWRKDSAAPPAEAAAAPAPAWTRREVIGPATLYLGDCLAVLPRLAGTFDLVTDPPYGIDYGRSGGFSASHGWGGWRENVEWDAERPSREIFSMLLAKTRSQIVWGGNYFTDYLPPSMGWLVWDKCQRSFSLADCELAWTSTRAAARVISFPRGRALLDGKEHPTQKPIEVMRWCIGHLPDPPRTILDPFMGSGTTGVAAVRMGRAFVGVERDPEYFEVACRRIRAALAQPDLLIAPPPAAPEPEQIGLGL